MATNPETAMGKDREKTNETSPSFARRRVHGIDVVACALPVFDRKILCGVGAHGDTDDLFAA